MRNQAANHSWGWLLSLVLVALASTQGSARAAAVQDRILPAWFERGRRQGARVDTIVLHFSSNVVKNARNPYDLDSVIKLYTNIHSSAHYVIDRGGKVYRLVKESDTAFHAGEGEWRGRRDTLNRYSIGIELLGIGTFQEMTNSVRMTRAQYDAIPKQHLGFTEAEYTALKELIADIRERHPAIKHDRQHIIGHDEYAPGRKFDPGALFQWSKIGL